MEAYRAEQIEKIGILKYLLVHYNDGRRKSFFCVAVNLMELDDLKRVLLEIEEEIKAGDLTLKEKAAVAATRFQAMADDRNLVLKLIKKKKE